MISVLMPFWNRSLALSRALALYDKWYGDLDLEVVIADDGSSDPPHLEGFSTRIQIIHLPLKDHPLCPVVPFNIAAKHAQGDVFVVTNPEIIHHQPVLHEMLAELRRQGENGYVLAAAYCREQSKWHCHSTECAHETPTPNGFGLHFLGMLNRSLWDKAGGFDPDYRDGNCFDDNDFAWRLFHAGAQCVIRDDLKVEHPKSGARTKWPRDGWMRNREIFKSKWPALASFV
jgi:glycosyltransferase involved in cell wall biosynthesis